MKSITSSPPNSNQNRHCSAMKTVSSASDELAPSKKNCEDQRGVNVKVIVRCRPTSELEKRDPSQFQVVSAKIEAKELFVSQTIPGRKVESYSKTFTFDGVCNQYTTQKELFSVYVVPIVEEVLQGFNCTIFAYGQTGTGKTYTMEGDLHTRTLMSLRACSSNSDLSRVASECQKDKTSTTDLTEHAGIIPRAVQHIFNELESQDSEYSVRVSYLEIYNEELNDLLNDGERQNLRIFENPTSKRGLSVDRLEEIPVNNPQDIFNILSIAVKKRRTAETLLNRQSSRSHCIFSVTIHMKETNLDGEEVIKIGKLNLVDLAGSENIQRSGANTVKDRAKEAGMINQSLLTLGRVINALVDHSSYVPYRDSKLTRLLQESLGGRTKTCIVATVSPSSLCLEETLSTLDYAFRAKNIRNRPEVNQRMTKRVMIRELNFEIEKLKIELQANREKNGVYLPYERFAEMEARLASQDAELTDASSEISQLRASAAGLVSQLETSALSLHKVREDYSSAKKELDEKRTEIEQLIVEQKNTTEELRQSKAISMKLEMLQSSLRQRCSDLMNQLKKNGDDLGTTLSLLSHYRTSGQDVQQKLEIFTDTLVEHALGSIRHAESEFKDSWLRNLASIHEVPIRSGEATLEDEKSRQKAAFLKVEETHSQISTKVSTEAEKISKTVSAAFNGVKEVLHKYVSEECADLKLLLDKIFEGLQFSELNTEKAITELLANITKAMKELQCEAETTEAVMSGLVKETLVITNKTSLDAFAAADEAKNLTAQLEILESTSLRFTQKYFEDFLHNVRREAETTLAHHKTELTGAVANLIGACKVVEKRCRHVGSESAKEIKSHVVDPLVDISANLQSGYSSVTNVLSNLQISATESCESAKKGSQEAQTLASQSILDMQDKTKLIIESSKINATLEQNEDSINLTIRGLEGVLMEAQERNLTQTKDIVDAANNMADCFKDTTTKFSEALDVMNHSALAHHETLMGKVETSLTNINEIRCAIVQKNIFGCSGTTPPRFVIPESLTDEILPLAGLLLEPSLLTAADSIDSSDIESSNIQTIQTTTTKQQSIINEAEVVEENGDASMREILNTAAENSPDCELKFESRTRSRSTGRSTSRCRQVSVNRKRERRVDPCLLLAPKAHLIGRVAQDDSTNIRELIHNNQLNSRSHKDALLGGADRSASSQLQATQNPDSFDFKELDERLESQPTDDESRAASVYSLESIPTKRIGSRTSDSVISSFQQSTKTAQQHVRKKQSMSSSMPEKRRKALM